MHHPNICKVFDGGLTEQGRPYFVPEYVKIVPFTDYCDRAKLPLNDRLKLFIAVCSAVQQAHHKGIVHRDLKPLNILICFYDGNPVPKVIDFGLAKALHQPLTEASIFTGHSVMVGTPLYMRPRTSRAQPPRHRHPHRYRFARRGAVTIPHRPHPARTPTTQRRCFPRDAPPH